MLEEFTITTEPLTVVVDRIKGPEGKEAELERELRAIYPIERDAALQHGAMSFELLVAPEPNDGFLMIQHWVSKEAFESFHANHRPPALQAFVDRIAGLIDRPLPEVASFWTVAS